LGWADVQENKIFTGADGVMVGETLLGNPCLFADIVSDPVAISLEYLDCNRRPWFRKFRSGLNACQTLDEFDVLLRTRVTRWRGKAGVDEIEVPGGEVPDRFDDS